MLLAAAFPLQKRSTCGMLENLSDALVGLGRALEILVGANLLADLLTLRVDMPVSRLVFIWLESAVSGQTRVQHTYLLGADGLLACLAELLNGLVVVTQILLAADQDDGKSLAEMEDLRNPLQKASTSVHDSQVALALVRDNLGWGRGEGPYLLLNVVQGVGRVDSKADQDNVGVGV